MTKPIHGKELHRHRCRSHLDGGFFSLGEGLEIPALTLGILRTTMSDYKGGPPSVAMIWFERLKVSRG